MPTARRQTSSSRPPNTTVLTEEPEDQDYPQDRSASDWLVPAVKGAVGGVPVVGGLLGEVLGFVWTPALQTRQAEWFKRLGERVEQLEGEVADLRERLESQEVLTVVINAARAAAATHEEGKREALRNAVINTALQVEPDEQIRLVFIRLIDRLTQGHLQLLALLDDPPKFFADQAAAPPEFSFSSSISQLIQSAFPDWESDLYARLAGDLSQEGLADASGMNTMMTAGGAMQPRSTPLGKRFLRFIAETD